jgi:hypothetical protein
VRRSPDGRRPAAPRASRPAPIPTPPTPWSHR